MTDKISFSVLIPFYHNETYLIQAVKSVVEQTWNDWEIVISFQRTISENCKSTLERLTKNITFVENSDTGMAENWNYAIAHANNEFSIILHADDQLQPQYMTEMASLIGKSEAVAWFCQVELINEDNDPVFSFPDLVKSYIMPSENPIILEGDKGLSSLLKGCFIYCPSVCYQTNTLKQYCFDVGWKMVTDLDLYGRFLLDGHRIVGSRDKWFSYRRHEENQTAKLTRNTLRFEEEIELYDAFAQQAKDFNWPITANVAKRKMIIKLHLGFQILTSLLKVDIKKVRQYFRLLWA